MNELELALTGDSAAAPPAHILEVLGAETIYRRTPGIPHTIYEELWHITFWQQITLEWIDGIETPFPPNPLCGFPTDMDAERQSWHQLSDRFFEGINKAAGVARAGKKLEQLIRCPSRPGAAVRTMSVREQLESLAAHNAYHFGRIVLLRQLGQAWPPPSGGFRW